MATDMATETVLYGRLVIVGKDGACDIEFPLDKKSILIGREHSCDIRIVNKEISRKHAEVYVEDTGAVFISSMGREPVVVNGAPVTSPLELSTGDKIEVLLENRSRVFYFHAEDDETVQIRGLARQPLVDANAAPVAAAAGAKPAAKGPAPPPPPPPPPGALRAAKPPAPAPSLPPPPAKAAQADAAPAHAGPALSTALEDAIKAGVHLKKVVPAEERPAAVPQAGAPFVPNPADLLKLKAGLRKTAASPHVAAAEPEQEIKQQDEQAAATAAPEQQAVVEETTEATAAPAELAGDVDVGPMETEAAEEPQQLQVAAPQLEAAPEKPAAVTTEAATDQPAGDVPMADAPAEEAPAVAAAKAAEPAAEADSQEAKEPATAPTSALRKRKSVRFHVDEAAAHHTPEGTARDATITIRLRKGDLEQIVNVDDNTVAFAQWGLGTMGASETPLPDTVVSKRSRHSNAPPSSVGKTPVPSGLRELLASSTPLSSGAQPTPGAAGFAAPAPTPATGVQNVDAKAAAQAEVVMNPQALASKLAELAEEHDVTVEVPADFFKSPGSKDGVRVTLTPKSAKARTPAAPRQEAAPASAAKSMPRTAGRSRLSQVGGAQPADDEEGADVERTQEVVVPAEVLEAATAVSSAKKQLVSASRRRSLSRTPGTKIVIVERGTQTTPRPTPGHASAKRAAAASQVGHQVTPRLLSTIAVQTEAEDAGDGVEQEQWGEGGSDDGSLDTEEEAAPEVVPLKQYQRAVVKAKACHAEARQLGAQLRRMTAKAAKLKKAAAAISEALNEERTKRQELQEAMQQVVLNRAAEVEERERQAAAAAAEQEADATAGVDDAEMQDAEQHTHEEMANEQQAVPEAIPAWQPRVIVLGRLHKAVSTAKRAGDVVVVRPAHLAAQHTQPASAPEMVVLPASARKAPAPSASKHAHTPAPSAAKGRTPAAAPGRTPATSAATATKSVTAAKSARKSIGGLVELPKSMVKEAPGTEGAKVVLENVELPGWLFQSEQPALEVEAAEAVVAAEQDAVAAAQDEVQRVEELVAPQQSRQAEATVVEQPQDAAESEPAAEPEAQQDAAAVAAPAEEAAELASEGEQDGEEEEEDFCHICGQSDEGDILLLCDSCDNACHLSCSNPPLKRVPKGDWFCVECVARQQAEAAAAAANAKPATSKRGGKKATAEVPAPEEEVPAAKPAGRGRRTAAAASSTEPEKTTKEEVAPAKPAARGRGAKRAAEEEPAPSEAPSGRGKRGRAAAASQDHQPAPSARTLRGKAAASTASKPAVEEAAEVSTRRGRGAAKAKEEAAPTRSTRSRR